ncbi:hypothetical protein DFH09DRAFT_1121516 [Mycena vulgaris]|nr:hypothetical protein DFH09DRAFT_1121516 [Mycena vulgaris]
MVDWQTQAEIIKDGAAFGKFMHVLLGLYIWEWFISLGFDWDFISGKRKFRWPMVFYFLNRYCLLFALVGIAIALNVTTEIDCQGLYTFNQCFGNAAIGGSDSFHSFRSSVLLKAAWDPEQGCIITSTDNHLLAVTFIYTMAFDFTVLSLTAYKLAFPAGGKSRLVSLIFNDGLIYFVIALVSNTLATIFMLLNLNAVMSIIANVPAAIASTIVACRAVRRLTNYSTTGAQMYTGGTTGSSTLAFRNKTQATARPTVLTKSSEGVHVQMETFESPSDRSYLECDATGKITRGETFDPEAQIMADEFKHPPY